MPYLPALAGVTMIDATTTQRIKQDFKQTISDLIVTNYYAHMHALCDGLLQDGNFVADALFCYRPLIRFVAIFPRFRLFSRYDCNVVSLGCGKLGYVLDAGSKALQFVSTTNMDNRPFAAG
jgi:hypothetical protein